jgi:hypothetical protein
MSVYWMTTSDWKQQDGYDDLHTINKTHALNDFYSYMSKLSLKVEHLVPKDLEGEEVYNTNIKVAKVIDDILYNSNFTYENTDGEFDYDFIKDANDFLEDSLGYYKFN